MVHHIVWRATGALVPELNTGEVVRHLCGLGRYGPNNPRTCITAGCLNVGYTAISAGTPKKGTPAPTT